MFEWRGDRFGSVEIGEAFWIWCFLRLRCVGGGVWLGEVVNAVQCAMCRGMCHDKNDEWD